MSRITDLIEEEVVDLEPWQREILDRIFPDPPPPPPPSFWTRVKRWWRRRKPSDLGNFDRALREVYGPGLREAVNHTNPIWKVIRVNDLP